MHDRRRVPPPLFLGHDVVPVRKVALHALHRDPTLFGGEAKPAVDCPKPSRHVRVARVEGRVALLETVPSDLVPGRRAPETQEVAVLVLGEVMLWVLFVNPSSQVHVRGSE